VKVFLIDDDSEEADLFSEALRRVNGSIDFVWHDDVMTAHDVLLREDIQPDLLFLDLNIPQVSGKQLLQLLRENERTKTIPVVIYSTSISDKDIEDTKAFNVDSYFQKPEDFQSLCIKLKELLAS